MASTYLTRTISTNNPTGRKTMTLSVWLKRGTVSATNMIFATGTGSERDMILFESDGKLQFSRYNGSYLYQLKTNRQFRDPNAWLHLVFVYDSTQSTSSNRLKIYVNGVQETSFATASYPSQDYQSNYSQSTYTQTLGRDTDGNFAFDGCMSHVHYIDGTALTPSTFGSTDATTGEWKINTSPSVTYGTNGFFLLKDDNSNLDRGGSNNFTINGTLTKIEDNPSNNFATWYADSFDKGNQVSFSNGNTTTADAGGTSDYDPKAWTTFGANTGKYYCEMKLAAFTTNRSYRAGVWFTEGNFSHEANANCFSGVKYTTTGNAVTIYSFGSDVQSGLASFSAGDILGIAVDIDNGTIQYYRNGSTYGSQITGLSSNFSGKSMMFCHTGEAGGGRTFTVNANFGNGYFGTTEITTNTGTGYQDADGNGRFYYTVPTNHRCLSTKGLNQ